MTVIILAAGLSERMGENKMLLPFNGHELILETISKTLLYTDNVITVIGYQKERMEEVLMDSGSEIVYAPDYLAGQMASTKRGIEAVHDDDFAILPGDLPFITLDDFIGCENALSGHQAARCVSHGIPGHPVMIRKEHRERILSFHGTMKDYLSLYDISTYNASPGSVFDADTPERYRMLLNGNLDLSVLH